MSEQRKLVETEADAALAFQFLADPARDVVMYHQGRRYGGFSSRDHAEWFAGRMGFDLAECVIEEGKR